PRELGLAISSEVADGEGAEFDAIPAPAVKQLHRRGREAARAVPEEHVDHRRILLALADRVKDEVRLAVAIDVATLELKRRPVAGAQVCGRSYGEGPVGLRQAGADDERRAARAGEGIAAVDPDEVLATVPVEIDQPLEEEAVPARRLVGLGRPER